VQQHKDRHNNHFSTEKGRSPKEFVLADAGDRGQSSAGMPKGQESSPLGFFPEKF
jgi:hypothetical protein